MTGDAFDLRAVTQSDAAAKSGVAHGEELVRLAEAVVSGDDEQALAGARMRVLDAVGPEGLVSAAAVVGNFQRMVRIADSIGIPLDAPVEILSQDLRDDLAAALSAASAR